MAPNVILIDAAYIDRVAAAFRQHFGAELGRELPKADLAQWLVCMALDAEIAGDVQCILIHDREVKVMANVTPGNFSQELDGQAFSETGLGEFSLACCPVERVVTLEDLCVESLEALLTDQKVERVAVVYDFDGTTAESRTLTKRVTKLCGKQMEVAADKATATANENCAPAAAQQPADTVEQPAAPKDVTLFTMRQLEGEGFAQQTLGFSLLAALGVGADEIQQA